MLHFMGSQRVKHDLASEQQVLLWVFQKFCYQWSSSESPRISADLCGSVSDTVKSQMSLCVCDGWGALFPNQPPGTRWSPEPHQGLNDEVPFRGAS